MTRTIALVIIALLFTLTSQICASPSLASGTRQCTTYHEAALNRWYTICADGTRAISTYNKTLQRWETTLTPPLGKTCTGTVNPRTQQVEVRCR